MIDPVRGGSRKLDQGRPTRFVVTPTGVRVAYAIVGQGPALVVPAAWIGHLEIAWQDPAVRAFYAPLAACRTVVAYDKPGCGLSDPWPGPQTLDSDLEVLRAVIDHLELGRVDLLGLSMGAPVSLAYAVQRPEGVGRLILYGGFAKPPDRRPAGDRGTLGRGTPGAHPPAAWREVTRPDRHLVGLRPR